MNPVSAKISLGGEKPIITLVMIGEEQFKVGRRRRADVALGILGDVLIRQELHKVSRRRRSET